MKPIKQGRYKNNINLVKANTENCQSTTSKPSSYTINNLPLNSPISSKRDDNADVNFSTVGGWIKKTTMPQNSFGGNIALLRKSESLESKTKDFSLASEANLPFLVPLAAYSAENPLDSRNRLISTLMFSSSRNFGESDILLPADGFGSIFQSVPDHFPGEAGIPFDYSSYGFPGSNQFYNVANQNSCTLECRFSVADFTIRDYEFANFGSHINNNDNSVFKFYDNRAQEAPAEPTELMEEVMAEEGGTKEAVMEAFRAEVVEVEEQVEAAD